MSQYATIADLQVSGLPAAAFGGSTAGNPITQNAALTRASALADTYLRDRYHLPLAEPYDAALIDAVCQIASYRLMTLRGYNPDSGADRVIRQGYDDAIEWLTRVARGQATLDVREATPPAEQPAIITSEPVGFGALGPFVNGSGNWGL